MNPLRTMQPTSACPVASAVQPSAGGGGSGGVEAGQSSANVASTPSAQRHRQSDASLGQRARTFARASFPKTRHCCEALMLPSASGRRCDNDMPTTQSASAGDLTAPAPPETRSASRTHGGWPGQMKVSVLSEATAGEELAGALMSSRDVFGVHCGLRMPPALVNARESTGVTMTVAETCKRQWNGWAQRRVRAAGRVGRGQQVCRPALPVIGRRQPVHAATACSNGSHASRASCSPPASLTCST